MTAPHAAALPGDRLRGMNVVNSSLRVMALWLIPFSSSVAGGQQQGGTVSDSAAGVASRAAASIAISADSAAALLPSSLTLVTADAVDRLRSNQLVRVQRRVNPCCSDQLRLSRLNFTEGSVVGGSDHRTTNPHRS